MTAGGGGCISCWLHLTFISFPPNDKSHLLTGTLGTMHVLQSMQQLRDFSSFRMHGSTLHDRWQAQRASVTLWWDPTFIPQASRTLSWNHHLENERENCLFLRSTLNLVFWFPSPKGFQETWFPNVYSVSSNIPQKNPKKTNKTLKRFLKPEIR